MNKNFFRFALILTLSFSYAQNPNDCINAINLCGDTDLNVDPLGIGDYEFRNPNNPPPSCYNFRADQVWFRIEIEETGTFSFALSPEQAQADYDFAVFGPTDDCNDLGPAIRCSSTNPNAAGVTGETGLNATESDTTEGPAAAGNGFLRELDVVQGEVYYIIIGLAVGTGGFTMSTSGSAELPPPPEINEIFNLTLCDDFEAQDGIVELDFSTYDSELIISPNTTVSYHETANDANLGINAITGLYQNSSSRETIYVRAERTDSDCVNFSEFELNVDDSDIDFTAEAVFFCSTRNTQSINFEDYLSEIEPDFATFEITYFDNETDASLDRNPIGNLRTATTTFQEDIIKFIDPTGTQCDFYVTIPYQVTPPPVFTTDLSIGLYCDTDYDDALNARLNEMDIPILNGQDATQNDVFYYATPEDRANNENTISNFPISSTPQEIYTEIRNRRTGCFEFGEVMVRLTSPPFLEQQEPKIYCENSVEPLILKVEEGFSFYSWSNGTQGPDAFETSITAAGDYTVTVTDAQGCATDLVITVNPSSIATIVDIETSSFTGNSNDATIVVTGSGDYIYDLDGMGFQDSNEFSDIFKGFHTVTVRDKNGCGIVSQEFAILDFEQFFTPNDDGFNDVWNIEAIEEFPEAKLAIFDRYGKVLYQLTGSGIGWDGTFNGELMPSSTYWFTLKVPDREVVRGYFALKR